MRSILVALALLACGAIAEAQQGKKVSRIGVFLPASGPATAHLAAAFREGIRDHGYVEGQNITLEFRYGEGKSERFAAQAGELVRSKVDAIVVGSTPGVLAAKNATRTIPIVMVTTGDPVAGGLISSLAHPGANVTGVTALGQELAGKRLELLKEAVPKVSRVAVLSNPANPDTELSLQGVKDAAQALGVQLQLQEVRDPNEFDQAFYAITRKGGAGTLMVLPDAMYVSQREKIVVLSAQKRLPAMYAHREFVDVGGLMFYGASLADMWRRAATYVDKILRAASRPTCPSNNR